jgi:superfamily II DNA helicase RecQ
MQALLEGNNVLVRAGTGSGKSLIFEAMTLSKRDAVVLVVSPIIALMNSQVDSPDIHS